MHGGLLDFALPQALFMPIGMWAVSCATCPFATSALMATRLHQHEEVWREGDR
jgi:hypothetical protein